LFFFVSFVAKFVAKLFLYSRNSRLVFSSHVRMPITIDTFVLGPLETNAYVVQTGGVCAVVDPGWDPAEIIRLLAERKLRLEMILLTHGHGDHIGGVADLKTAYPQAKLYCPKEDLAMLSSPAANLSGMFGVNITCPQADIVLGSTGPLGAPRAFGACADSGRSTQGHSPERLCYQSLELGGIEIKVLDTSGHTRGGVSYYLPGEAVVFTGDALFAGSIGRTDIPGGSASRLLRNIRDNLLGLDKITRVFPGHGPATSVEQEARSNPFFR
jgi:glyoxylase-like metal-dependent hydrolase (beta-lactamase superfamily II)